MPDYLTTPEQRAGLLIAVPTGNRPRLEERPTRLQLDALEGFGSDIIWLAREADAERYQQDHHELVAYPDEWCAEYAASHWLKPDPPPEQFPRLFCGREYACLEAERRGCWGVLQLDDNIVRLAFPRNIAAGVELVKRHGGMALFVDLLAAITLSTNGWMVGAALTSVAGTKVTVARPGFPYSCFIERSGPGREHYYGPIEEDIIQAFQYGTRAGPGTALLVPLLRYCKEFSSTGGMRPFYDSTRSIPLHQLFPESAKVVLKHGRSNGMGAPRVFHHMTPRAIRNRMKITDPVLFQKVADRMGELLMEWHSLHRKVVQEKIVSRAQRR